MKTEMGQEERFISLLHAKVNNTYKICKVDSSGKIERRLYDLGFLVGVEVKVLKKSLLNGVFLIEIMGGVLALKRKEVTTIFVEQL